MPPPILNHDLRISPIPEPFQAETFVPELPVEGFVFTVLPRFSRIDQRSDDVRLQQSGPPVEMKHESTIELRAIHEAPRDANLGVVPDHSLTPSTEMSRMCSGRNRDRHQKAAAAALGIEPQSWAETDNNYLNNFQQAEAITAQLMHQCNNAMSSAHVRPWATRCRRSGILDAK